MDIPLLHRPTDERQQDAAAPGSIAVSIDKVTPAGRQELEDQVAIEEPLEIRIAFGPPDNRVVKPISITMRTPGNDFELALGFLLAEGILRSLADIDRYYFCGPETGGQLRLHNVVRVELVPEVALDLTRLERHFYTTSSCGVCGKTSIQAIQTACPTPLQDEFRITQDAIHALPEFLRAAQGVFDKTGGLHAAALFEATGKLAALREDVGRHNAVDKVIGSQILTSPPSVPVRDKLLLVSGRASFELVQKSIMAGIPMLAAVGAPSSLAVELAREFHLTLLGFVRNNRFNIYSAPERLLP